MRFGEDQRLLQGEDILSQNGCVHFEFLHDKDLNGLYYYVDSTVPKTVERLEKTIHEKNMAVMELALMLNAVHSIKDQDPKRYLLWKQSIGISQQH